MQYMEQGVCRQVTGRFLASRKEGQAKGRGGRGESRDNSTLRDKVRRRVGWRTLHLSSDDRTQETLLYMSNCIPRADTLGLTLACFPNNSIEYQTRKILFK
jgi:hypothetical protein